MIGKKIKVESEEINKGLAANIDKGVGSPEVQALIGRHHAIINKFYDCSMEIYRGLAEMYVADERFAAYYRPYHKDLPEFLKEAMLYFADHYKK